VCLDKCIDSFRGGVAGVPFGVFRRTKLFVVAQMVVHPLLLLEGELREQLC
jgi:hypothetical protein